MHPIFERFMHPATTTDAEQDLLAQGTGAVATLATLFSGEAKNQWGIPYRQFGPPLRCALDLARRMGPLAKPLEPFLRAELDDGSVAAAMALGALGTLDNASVQSLARRLRDGADMASESAIALIKCGMQTHPLVTHVLANSYQATREFRRSEAFFHQSRRQA